MVDDGGQRVVKRGGAIWGRRAGGTGRVTQGTASEQSGVCKSTGDRVVGTAGVGVD